MKTMFIQPVMLVIMDGWGYRKEKTGNAVRLAKTPHIDSFEREFPFTLLKASGEAVGLPAGQMGNSEVGHLNIGAGRIVYQDFTRIDKAIEDGSFFKNQTFLRIMKRVKELGSTLHLFGLVSKGGVHSDLGHLFSLIRMARDQGINRLEIHAFMDGRDTPPKSGAGYLRELKEFIDLGGVGQIATVIGRFYAMDRDKRWDRIKIAYDALTEGAGRMADDPVAAVEGAYSRDETDEFIKPIIIRGTSRVRDNDGVIFFNFRADRARELTRAFTEEEFKEFKVNKRPELAGFVTMTMYDEEFSLPIAFPPVHLARILGEVVSSLGLRQLRIAETEKYAHVTYFFNGGEEEPFDNEDRCLIPSPRDVPTYDLRPEMSAGLIRDELLKRMGKGQYQLIVVNFANGDMVGHTGVLDAAIKACHVVDQCVGAIVKAWLELGGISVVTADHGNAEKMIDQDGSPFTAHTTSPVPLYLIDPSRKTIGLERGKLGDIAPTVLKLMGISPPEEMTGKVLF